MSTDQKPVIRSRCPQCGYLIEVPRIGERTVCTECGGEWQTHDILPLLPPTRAQRARMKLSNAMLVGLVLLALATGLALGFLALPYMIRWLMCAVGVPAIALLAWWIGVARATRR